MGVGVVAQAVSRSRSEEARRMRIMAVFQTG